MIGPAWRGRTSTSLYRVLFGQRRQEVAVVLGDPAGAAEGIGDESKHPHAATPVAGAKVSLAAMQ